MTITATTIKTLLDMGASRWTKGDHDRLYLNAAANTLINLKVNYYNSGNIRSATLNGEKISNAEAGRIYNALGNAYINLKTGSVAVVNNDHDASKALKAAIADIIEKENAQDATPEPSSASADQDTDSTTYEMNGKTTENKITKEEDTMTQEYRINYHTEAGNETINSDDIATVTDKADEGAAYTQENISITDENGNPVAIRRWCGVAYNPDTSEESNPIIFGTFGYYSDWQDA